MTMNRVPGSEFTVSTDMVFLALGFLGPTLDGLVEELGVELSVIGAEKSRKPAAVKKMLKNTQPVYTICSNEKLYDQRRWSVCGR